MVGALPHLNHHWLRPRRMRRGLSRLKVAVWRTCRPPPAGTGRGATSCAGGAANAILEVLGPPGPADLSGAGPGVPVPWLSWPVIRGASVRNFTTATFRTLFGVVVCGGCVRGGRGPWWRSAGRRRSAAWRCGLRWGRIPGARGQQPPARGAMHVCDAAHKTRPDPGWLR
jgi:hypothetical protein